MPISRSVAGWSVDPAELARVYGIGNSQAKSEIGIGEMQPDMRLLLEVERTKTAGLEAHLADTDRVVNDLRRRLDAEAEAEERRRLTALLTDRSTTPAAHVAPHLEPPAPRRWRLPWRRR